MSAALTRVAWAAHFSPRVWSGAFRRVSMPQHVLGGRARGLADAASASVWTLHRGAAGARMANPHSWRQVAWHSSRTSFVTDDMPREDVDPWEDAESNMARKPPLQAVHVDASGTARSMRIQRHELSKLLRVEARDVRAMDVEQVTSVLVREHAFLVNLHHIKAVVQHDSFYVFDGDHPAVQRVVEEIGMRVKTDHAPFEFVVLESLLISVVQSLERDLETILPAVAHTLESLMGLHSVEKDLEALLPLKNSMAKQKLNVSEVMGSLGDLLRTDEDMSAMYLTTRARTGHRRRVDQHEEVEMLLETYYKQVEEIKNEISSMETMIRYTEDIVKINMDSMRNKMLKVELMLTMGTFSAAGGGLVAGVFGMNLLSGLESHPHAMALVSSGIFGGSAITFLLLYRSMRRRRIL